MGGLEGIQLGNFKLGERLSSGGMAEVYRAKQITAFDKEVAVKVIRSGFDEDPMFRMRFLREVQAIAKLDHPHILSLIDFGQEKDVLYLVMPLAPETLHDLLERRSGPLPLEEALPLFTQLCQAVASAHKQGIIHRDIKPKNVLLREGNYVLLADFGIAFHQDETRLTREGAGIGSPEYMAPEQIIGEPVVHSDIYSLGVVLYQLLTGKVPYPGTSSMQVYRKILSEPLPDPRIYNPALPPDLAQILSIALAKDPKDRFGSPLALANAAQQAAKASARMEPPPSPPASGRLIQPGAANSGVLPAPPPAPPPSRQFPPAVAAASGVVAPPMPALPSSGLLPQVPAIQVGPQAAPQAQPPRKPFFKRTSVVIAMVALGVIVVLVLYFVVLMLFVSLGHS